MLTATPTQYEALDALARHGTMKAAAYSLGIGRAALDHRLRKLRRRSGLTTVQLVFSLGRGCVLIQDTIWPDARQAA